VARKLISWDSSRLSTLRSGIKSDDLSSSYFPSEPGNMTGLVRPSCSDLLKSWAKILVEFNASSRSGNRTSSLPHLTAEAESNVSMLAY